MMWNQNDTKYIIKRLILYIVISCIVFFGASKCAKAMTVSSAFFTTGASWPTGRIEENTNQVVFYPYPNSIFNNVGTGYVNFNILVTQAGQFSQYPYDYRIKAGNNVFQCEIGYQQFYTDNTSMRTINSVRCPVFVGNEGIQQLIVTRNGTSGVIVIQVSPLWTFTADSEVSSSIMNGTNSIIQSQISNDNANAQAIQNSINSATQQQISAINASIQATNDNTDAINAQTQWQQQNFQYDTSWSDSLNLFGNDTNYIRQLLMWPFTFSLVIGQSLGGNSCNAYTFGSLYGTQITLPCINWKNYVGNTIYTIIDTIMGIVILFGVITYIRKVFEYVFSFGAKAYETVDVEVFK